MKLNLKKLFGIAILSLVSCVSVFAAQAEVISVKGKVEVCRNEEWIPLKVGDNVNKSEMISTGFQSEAKIKMGDSILQLGALSRVTLESLSSSGNKEVIDVYLNTGAVRSKVNHTSDKKVSYTVRNPIAVASVRGTEFMFIDTGTATCTEGAIALAPAKYYETNIPDGGRNADDVEAPADGESDASTPATDIAPSTPKGSVVVLAGQSASISANGTTTTPQTNANKNVTKAASSVTTAATTEAVSTAPSTTTYVSSSSNLISAPTTGTVIVVVEFE